jgi:hypothetical protein
LKEVPTGHHAEPSVFGGERGRGAGKGYNINIPLPERVDGERYLGVLKEALGRVRYQSPRHQCPVLFYGTMVRHLFTVRSGDNLILNYAFLDSFLSMTAAASVMAEFSSSASCRAFLAIFSTLPIASEATRSASF